MSTNLDVAAGARLSGKQKTGLVLCALYSLANIPSVLLTGSGGSDEPPMGILVIDTVLGVIGLVAAILAWRGNRVALRVAAGAVIVITITALPAFFVDVGAAIKVVTGVSVLLTVVMVVLMFSAERRSVSVTD